MRPRGRVSRAPQSRCSGTPAESSCLRRSAVPVPVLSPRHKLLLLSAGRKSPKFCSNLGSFSDVRFGLSRHNLANFPEFWVASLRPGSQISRRYPRKFPQNLAAFRKITGQLFGKFRDLSGSTFLEHFGLCPISLLALFALFALLPSCPLSIFPSFPLSLFPSFPLSRFPAFPLSRSLSLSLSLKSVVTLLTSASVVLFKQTVNRL